MKKIISTLITVLPLICVAQAGKFQIDGTINNMRLSKIYLMVRSNGETKIDRVRRLEMVNFSCWEI